LLVAAVQVLPSALYKMVPLSPTTTHPAKAAGCIANNNNAKKTERSFSKRRIFKQ
jgi:hypothetical protein